MKLINLILTPIDHSRILIEPNLGLFYPTATFDKPITPIHRDEKN
ncbi:MAG: hypothetical protein ABJ004_13380 [Cyclobacteriaceae bacterium]